MRNSQQNALLANMFALRGNPLGILQGAPAYRKKLDEEILYGPDSRQAQLNPGWTDDSGNVTKQGINEYYAKQPVNMETVEKDYPFLAEPDFQAELNNILGQNPNIKKKDIYQIIKGESNYNPAAKNPDSSATGLFQFIESTAKNLGTTTDEISKMTPTQQIKLYGRYIGNYRNDDAEQTIPSNNQGAMANPLFDPNNQGRINVNLSNDNNIDDKPDINTSYTQGGFGIPGNSKFARKPKLNRTVAKRVNEISDVLNVFDAKAGIPYSGQRDYSPGLASNKPGQDDKIYDIQNEDGTYTRYTIPGNIKQEDIPDWIESDEGKSKAGMFPNPSETTNAEVVNANKDLFNFGTADGRRNFNLGLDPDNAEVVDAEPVDAEPVDAQKTKSRLGNLLTPQAFGAEDSRLSKLNELIDSDYMPKGRDNKKYLMGLVGSILADRYGDPTVDTNNFGQFLENTQTQDLQDRQAFEKRRDEAIALRDSLRADKDMIAGTLGIYRVDTPEGPQNIGGYYRKDGTFTEAPEMFMGGDMSEVGITNAGGVKTTYKDKNGFERDGFTVKVNGEPVVFDALYLKQFQKDFNLPEQIQKHEQFIDKFATQDQFTQKLLNYARDDSGKLLSDDEIRKSFQGIVGPIVGRGNETIITLLQSVFGKAAKTSEIFSALKSFKSGDYSIAYDTLNGAGQITEFEAATVAASYNMVNRATDAVTFVKALEEHRQNMIRLANNQKARLGMVGYEVDTGFAKSDWKPSSNVNYKTITNIKDYES